MSVSYRQPSRDPDPTTAAGIIAGFGEGIAFAFMNKIVVLIFSQLATIQQSLNPVIPEFHNHGILIHSTPSIKLTLLT